MPPIPQTVIAIVADCDDTLAPDTTAQLLQHFKIKSKEFYENNVAELIDKGYDPSIAYMQAMLTLANDGPLKNLTQAEIQAFAKKVKWYPGIPEVFVKLEKEINDKYGKFGIRLEEYVITGGLADLIQASELGQVVEEIWGCNFAYDSTGKICGIKNVVSFTEKTKFLFSIEKGLRGVLRTNPYAVNQIQESEERPIPIRNMVYLGDGPSDVPCMSIVQKSKGYVIGILSDQRPYKTWALGYGRRANVTVPPDFRKGKHGWNQLREAVIQIADRIKAEFQPGQAGHVPKH